MAQGTIKWFAQALYDIGRGEHDLSTADLRLGFVSTATVPTIDIADPHWGGTGVTDFSASQVSTAGTSYTGPFVLGSESWSLTASGGVLNFDSLGTIAKDPSGPTNVAYGILFNNSDVNKRALGYLELSSTGTVSLVANPLLVNLNAAGALALAQG